MSTDFDRLAIEMLTLSELGVLLCLLNVRHIDGRSVSVLLFCRKSVSNPNFRRSDDVFDVTDPDIDFWLRLAAVHAARES
jgi:hypothetical protein